MERTAKDNPCPVCGESTKENETITYCESCGFNHTKKETDVEPQSS